MEQETRDKRINIPLSQSEWDALENFRFASRMPSRAEAVRELMRRGVRCDETVHQTG